MGTRTIDNDDPMAFLGKGMLALVVRAGGVVVISRAEMEMGGNVQVECDPRTGDVRLTATGVNDGGRRQ